MSIAPLLAPPAAPRVPPRAPEVPWRARQLEEVAATLRTARAVLVHGWVQDDWYVLRRPDGRRYALGPYGAAHLSTGDVVAACVVGAVVSATRTLRPGTPPADAQPALDALWDALQEERGVVRPAVAGRAASRHVREARVRDLTRFNDSPQRSRHEVLALVDRALDATLLEAVHLPDPGAGRR